MEPLKGDDHIAAEAGLDVLLKQERAMLLEYADALTAGHSAPLPHHYELLREVQRNIRRYRMAMKRAEIEAAA